MEPLEIELKFAAPAGFDERSLALGAAPTGTHTEQDHYYNAPDRDFAVTNEALRIRMIDGKCRFTYKGPRLPGPAKTRKEIELGIADELPTAKSLLESLGYRFVALVEKRRTSWTLTRGRFELTLTRDDVSDVGEFVEVEIVADPSSKPEAEAVLLGVCSELGLRTPEPRSYLRMLLESGAK